jgi:hypothetical protein
METMNPLWPDEYPDDLPIREQQDKIYGCYSMHGYCVDCKYWDKCAKILEVEE